MIKKLIRTLVMEAVKEEMKEWENCLAKSVAIAIEMASQFSITNGSKNEITPPNKVVSKSTCKVIEIEEKDVSFFDLIRILRGELEDFKKSSYQSVTIRGIIRCDD